MKDKLEVGMYVRTKKGIAKIIDIILEPDNYYFKMWVTDKYLEITDDAEYISEVDVLKASYNIIDLIEVGDYVNGFRVVWVNLNNKTIEINSYYLDDVLIKNKQDIKSIVTKEIFSSMEYRLGDE